MHGSIREPHADGETVSDHARAAQRTFKDYYDEFAGLGGTGIGGTRKPGSTTTAISKAAEATFKARIGLIWAACQHRSGRV
jgi:hypothetical protein